VVIPPLPQRHIIVCRILAVWGGNASRSLPPGATFFLVVSIANGTDLLYISRDMVY
jgi:hypothetical protein